MQEERAIEEATSEVNEAKKARAKQKGKDSKQQGKQKDRLEADKEYLSRLTSCPLVIILWSD